MKRLILVMVCLAALFAVRSASPRGVFSAGESGTIGGRQVNIWRPRGDGPAPLIIFSHGFAGCGGQSSFLTQALAEAGYLVVAPRHADAWCGETALTPPQAPFWEPSAWSDATYRDRRDDIAAVLDALKRDPAFAGRIDWSEVGLLGHSLGGYTVLGIAGGWPAWRIPGVKAVVALSPYCAPFLAAGTLGGIAAPVEYQGGTYDFGLTPIVSEHGGCFDRTPAPAAFVEFKGAGHLAWTDLVGTDHPDMIFYVRAFFDAWLRGQSPAPLKTRRSAVADLRVK